MLRNRKQTITAGMLIAGIPQSEHFKPAFCQLLIRRAARLDASMRADASHTWRGLIDLRNIGIDPESGSHRIASALAITQLEIDQRQMVLTERSIPCRAVSVFFNGVLEVLESHFV
jgi:hypothetical protein